MSNEEIEQELTRMDKQAKAIHDEAIRITWWMRGGITLHESYNLDKRKRKLVSELIDDNIKAGKKSGTPII